MPRIVGLTGGIGAGKSTVAREFRRLGVTVIDMDQVGRNLSKSPKVVAKLNRIAKIRPGKGQRRRLRAALFASPSVKKRIERFLHPLIWREFHRRTKRSKQSFIICEAALLIESKHTAKFAKLIVVLAPKSLRKKRACARDKMSSELFEAIVRHQCSDSVRRRHADFLIRNQGSLSELRRQTAKLLEKLE